MPAAYVALNTADVALTAATAKTVVSVINAANSLFHVKEFGMSFDGTSASAEPVTVELCSCTQATAGTSTAFTLLQYRGSTRTVQATAAVNFTAEPTVVTVLGTWLVHPQSGITIQYPLGEEPEMTVTADALLLRVTSPATLNCRGYMKIGEG